MARAEAHLVVGYMLAIYIDAAHSYGGAGEGQCSGKPPAGMVCCHGKMSVGGFHRWR